MLLKNKYFVILNYIYRWETKNCQSMNISSYNIIMNQIYRVPYNTMI